MFFYPYSLPTTSRTTHLDPSIYLQYRPIHIPTLLPKQERHHIRHLLGRTQPLQRITQPHPLHRLPALDYARVRRRVNIPGRNAIDSNTSWTQLEREGFGHAN